MPLTLRLISNLGLLGAFALALALAGCAAEPLQTRSDEIVQRASYQKIYYYPYEAVWRAAQLSLKYSIAVNNMDNGVLETDWIRGVDGYIAPFQDKPPSPGVRYKIQMSLVKGRVDRRNSVRVTIVKKIEKQRDFFSEPESLETDGFEEKVLFYRMERELIIEDALKKATK